MKRTLLATLVAAGTLVSAQSFAAGYSGDDNDGAWLKSNATAQQDRNTNTTSRFAKSSELPGFHNGVRFGDENNDAWLPGAKR
jgi:hypothetical protein